MGGGGQIYPFPERGCSACSHIEPKHYRHLKKFCTFVKKGTMMDKMNRDPKTSNYVDGLSIKQGRLINERPDGMTGIQEAANLRRMKKVSYQEQMIANGIERAEMRKEMMKEMRKMF